MKEPKKILIVRTDRLGDVILSTPVIKSLRKKFPKAYIAFMCRPYTREVLEGNPYLDEVIICDRYGKHKNIWGIFKLSSILRKKGFDWAIILHPTNRVHLVTFLAGIKFRIGWDRKLGFLLNKRIPHNKQEGKKHELEYTLDILRELEIPIVDSHTYFPISDKSEKRIEELLKKQGLGKDDKFIVIHPSASCPSKRWPQSKFSQVIKILREKDDLGVVVIAAADEKEFGKKLVEENKVIDLRGKLSVSEVGSLLKRSLLFISNDSGPVHIGASLDIPVISIFGRKDPGLSPLRWQPLGDNSFYFHKDVGCQVCLAHNCDKGFLCLEEISPQEVAQKAISILDKVLKP
jgi:heptosyltransferase-2